LLNFFLKALLPTIQYNYFLGDNQENKIKNKKIDNKLNFFYISVVILNIAIECIQNLNSM